MTALFYAIEQDRDEAIDVIMLAEKDDLLMEQFECVNDNSPLLNEWRMEGGRCALTCLHMLAEKDKTRAVRLFMRLCRKKTESDIREMRDFIAMPTWKQTEHTYDTNAPTERLLSCIHIAAANGNTELVDLLLKNGADIDQTYGKEFVRASPMACAVEKDRLETFRKLVTASKVFGGEKKTEHIAHFLRTASVAGAKQMVEELLKMATNSGVEKTKLIQKAIDEGCVEAIRLGHHEIAELLAQALDTEKLNEALCEAIKRGNKVLVEDLLDKGAEVDDLANDNVENSPLMVCVKHDKTDVLSSLLPKANIIPEDFWKGVASSKDDFARQAFESFAKSKKSKDEKLTFTNNTVTPMHIAASLDKIDVLMQFGNLGARYDLVDPRGNTILHTAAQNNAQIITKEALEYFNPALKNKDGDTPLHVACKNSRPRIIEMMVKRKDQPYFIQNNFGDIPLHLAVKQLLGARQRTKAAAEKILCPPTREDKQETLEMVVQAYSATSQLDKTDAKGNTALNLLIQGGKEAEIRLFVNACPSLKNNEGLCPLDYAMRSYYTKPSLLNAMLNTFGARAALYLATEFKHEGYPPLHLFVMKRDLQNVKLLVENGASVTELNDEGLNIIHMIAQLTTEDDNNKEVYIMIARIIIDTLIDHRIKRQVEFFKYLSENFESFFTFPDNEKMPTINDEVTFSGAGDDVPLITKTKRRNTNGFLSIELAESGLPFLVSSGMSRDDIRRVLLVYLTRLVKSRSGLSVVNYSATLRAVDYLKYILEVRKRINTKPPILDTKQQLDETIADEMTSPEKTDDRRKSESEAYRTMSVYEGNYGGAQDDYDALQPDTIQVSYDVSCLSPETMTSFSQADMEWVIAALEEKFLYHVFYILQKKKKHLFQSTEEHMTDKESPIVKIMDKAKNWGIHEFFAKLENNNNLVCPKTGVKSAEPEKTKEKRRNRLSFIRRKKRDRKPKDTNNPAMLETIVELKDEVMAAKILDLMPLTKLVEGYWSVYRWMYFIIMLLHVIYMSIFSAFTIGDMPSCANRNRSSDEPIDYPNRSYVMFLFYPFIFLVVTIYFEAVQIVARRQHAQGYANTAGKQLAGMFTNMMDVPYDALKYFFENLPTIASVIFAFCMLFWYIKYMSMCDNLDDFIDHDAAYLLSACLAIGWLQTITYSRGFESLHSFKNVMKSIVLSDILRFFTVYIFVNIGFAFGFHVLQRIFLPDDELSKHQPTPLHSVFYNLKFFTNPADIFEFDHFQSFQGEIGLMYVRLAFLMYSFGSGLILVNILIAMMNDSYTRVNEMERITWRVECLRQAMAVFRAFPFIMKIKERVSRGSESQTHLTTLEERPSVRLYDICCTVNVNDDEPEVSTDDRLDAIERDVKSLQGNMEEIGGKMDVILENREDMKMLMTALMSKVEECNSQLKFINAAKSTETQDGAATTTSASARV